MVVAAEIRTPGLAFHVLYVTSGRMSCSILYLQQNVPGLSEGGCSLSDCLLAPAQEHQFSLDVVQRCECMEATSGGF